MVPSLNMDYMHGEMRCISFCLKTTNRVTNKLPVVCIAGSRSDSMSKKTHLFCVNDENVNC